MKKTKTILGLIILTIVIMSINVNSAFVIKGENDELLRAYKNNNLIRLHIVASTNSPNDQYIKRIIREKIINYIKQHQEEMQIQNNVYEKDDIFNDDMLKNLENYLYNYLLSKDIVCPVEVSFGQHHFPGRTYSELTLPKGEYQALKVKLGRGEGANWWCVLMPPLCIEKQDNKKMIFSENREKIKDLKFKIKFFEIIKNEKQGVIEEDNKIEIDLLDQLKNIVIKNEKINTFSFTKIENIFSEIDNIAELGFDR